MISSQNAKSDKSGQISNQSASKLRLVRPWEKRRKSDNEIEVINLEDEEKSDTSNNKISNEENESKLAEDTSEDDYQLNRAIDLLKSISVYDNLKKAS